MSRKKISMYNIAVITFMLIAVIFLAAGFIQGVSGFGSALLAMPLLTMFIDVKTAVPLCILNSFVMTSYLSLQLRAFIDREKVLPLLSGSIPGIWLGVMFLKEADPDIIKFLLGVMIISYSVYSLFFHPGPRKMHKAWSYAAGFGTGFIGSAFSAGGPPAIIYTTLTDWSKDHIKATLSGFFFISSLVTVIVHAVSGMTDRVVLGYFSVSAVFVLTGAVTGSRVYGRMGRSSYVRVILFILIVLGLMMSGSAL